MKAQILVGSGLGASATLCVALTRWFEQLGVVSDKEAFHFAKALEDLFHGESSGVDVAVVLAESGLIFKRGDEPVRFKAQVQPEWYLSHCGEKGITKECVNKVKSLETRNPALFAKLDEQMKRSVELCLDVLSNEKPQVLLHEALGMAQNCFEEWGLVTPALDQHMKLLKSQGALAMKPTGSGGGGFVLSLWEKEPQVQNIKFLKASVLAHL